MAKKAVNKGKDLTFIRFLFIILLFMLAKNNRSESWLEALKFIGHCPICNQHYEENRAKLFAKHDVANLIHITCGKCSSNFIAMVVMMGQGMSSVGMVTDLSFDDAKQLYKTAPLTVDEIIGGYKFIEKNY
ncbi:MAG: hypothetical protein A2537_02485 [Candidatus Magasanikbacteria bacterium RIFOXYD2_FULL_36_9]|uniref:Uncharacterized protein n=1 Tax=Candidatus Magasanikbacteria bacterium RIFOXYD2_FULL_36_9 TaxID=1798707 RepID=A0A1F6P036_9BACT|nr:MAG: hypothetical protein A2537_02485 [Candidatus Magasanikbacteria bacterium RIFOXYD2_FULL_36_9]